MCTVTYISVPKGFVLTSNRDEIISRSDTVLTEEKSVFGERLFYPKDPLADGTWFAVTPTRAVCLLNGGFTKHRRVLPYRKSRGLIVRECFQDETFADFVAQVDLDNIEPFTIISVESEKELKVTELVWDGAKKWVIDKNPSERHIWSSSTLYSAEIKLRREDFFNQIKPENASAVLDFHQNAGTELGPEQQFKMFRANGPETISTTQLEKQETEIRFCHINYASKTQIQWMTGPFSGIEKNSFEKYNIQ